MSRRLKKRCGPLAGMAEIDVTPRTPVLLAGYNDPEKKRIMTGVHDRLYARACVLQDGAGFAAMLSVPVVSLDAGITREIRDSVCKATGIPASSILVAATHTHSAPRVEGAYRDFLRDRCVAVLRSSFSKRVPARMGFGVAHVENCGRNRRYLDYGGLPVDPEVGVLRIEDRRGELKGLVYNYACHATTLGWHNRLISEDWPCFTKRMLARRLGSGVVCLFLQGASGDINPGYSAGLSAVAADIPIRTWSEAKKIGERLAGGILNVYPKIRVSENMRVRSLTGFVDLPLRTSLPVTVARSKKDLARARAEVRRLKAGKRTNRKSLERAKMKEFFAGLIAKKVRTFSPSKSKAKAELQAIRLGKGVITTFPGEVFVDVALDVKRQSPARTTFVACLANTLEASGYLPTREAFEEGDYEVFQTPYRERAAEVLARASVRLINRVWRA